MTTDWKPKAPPARKAFNKAEADKAPETRQRDGSVSKAELNRLENQREKPNTSRTLAPGGATQYASSHINRHREDRIEHAQRRLRRMKSRARKDFDRSR
ncbi:MAG: hypothetical protein HPY30_00880 [Gammaproteobacteria bacterium (ex Lamellibrachia satsuma)]|nr:MAG: hypothetical protein HPY30_00880 [Gammaproteobacteria bacterium (ex Lamellibrachia satsuma)]